jgi:hypothetical protein
LIIFFRKFPHLNKSISSFIIKIINKNYREYLIELKKHKYAICPEGNAIDTHRFWECIYMGVIPICKRNKVVEYFSKNFEINIVDDWDRI